MGFLHPSSLNRDRRPSMEVQRQSAPNRPDKVGGCDRTASRAFIVRITAKAEYACLAIIALARRHAENRPIHIREIAQDQGIPETTLTQVLLKLKRAGLVRSTRGSAGGYWLAHPPEEISLGRILFVIDGENGTSRELQGASARVLASVWDEIRATERRLLEQTSIAQIADRAPTFNWVI
jgi:Rrf2 family transcriptional regulator, cysteine metabolism repressor